MRLFVCIFASLLLLLTSAANAKDSAVTVNANRTTPINGFWVFAEANCHNPGRLKHHVDRKPEHGKVDVRFEMRAIPKEVSKRCAGRRGAAMVIYYTPDRGYRGKDSTTVSFQFPQYEGGYGSPVGRQMKFSISVK